MFRNFRWMRSGWRVAFSVPFNAAVAWAPARSMSITVGPYTPSTTTPFVVPIDIAGAIGLTAWTFDLAFDRTDLASNTACDPFSDGARDLLTGPVTPGTYFTGPSIFPALFVPGFVLTDVSLHQTGRLIGVSGAWQDPSPGPRATACSRSSNSSYCPAARGRRRSPSPVDPTSRSRSRQRRRCCSRGAPRAPSPTPTSRVMCLSLLPPCRKVLP